MHGGHLIGIVLVRLLWHDALEDPHHAVVTKGIKGQVDGVNVEPGDGCPSQKLRGLVVAERNVVATYIHHFQQGAGTKELPLEEL
jgi:hypothetical protein